MKLVTYIFGNVVLFIIDSIPGFTQFEPRWQSWKEFYECETYGK